MKKILYGASGHAKVIIDVIKSNNEDIYCIIDDNPKTNEVFNIPVKRVDQLLFEKSNSFLVAIGNNKLRKKIVSDNDFNYFTAIHEKTIIASSVEIGGGTVVMPNVVINAEAKIGKHCIVNTSAVVEHECILSDFVHVSPNASIAGNVTIGEGTQVGIGACVIQGVKIGKWVTIGAGTIIIKDIPDYAVVVGNPGKIIKYSDV